MIKLINILNEIVEGKQVGNLYHWTELDNISDIINSNMLRTSPTTGDFNKKIKLKCISFTRTPNKEQFEIAEISDVLLVLDGNKLSNNYKITPHHDTNQFYFSDEEYDEMEERVCKDIINLDKYLLKIIFYKITPEIESLLKEKNINYKIKNVVKEILVRNKTVNADYFQQVLDKSNKISISQRKYVQDIIDDIRKHNNKATDRQYIIFQRVKNGDWNYSTKN